MTGANNRGHFIELANRDILRGARYKETLVLLLIDIDHFKAVNDTYGHSVGDEALKKMVEVCKSEIRSFDTFGRIGGEEFAILLTKSDATTGFHFAERLRKAVEQSILVTDKGVVRFTISVGAVVFAGNHFSLDLLMKKADSALYKAKELGRNQTVIEDERVEKDKTLEVQQKGLIRLEWSNDYESSNKLINEQHQELFRLSNMLLAALIDSKDKDICLQYMEELISHVVKHFNTEEDILKTIGYPGYEEHRQIHLELTKLSSKIVKRYKEGQIGLAEVFNFLVIQVVKQHMLEEDQKFFNLL